MTNKPEKIKQAVILAGGMGTRLRPLTDKVPKPMIIFYEKPFLEYLLELLKSQGITEIILLLGYLSEKVIDYFEDGRKLGLTIKYSVRPVEFDTGKRLKEAEELLAEHFLLCYCDNYLPFDLEKMLRFYNQKNVLMSGLVYTNKDGFTTNNIKVNENDSVILYDKSRQSDQLSGVDLGFFITDKRVVADMGADNISLQETLVKLVEKKQLAGFLTDQPYCGLSRIERVAKVAEYLRPKKIIFLDRDGVINIKAPKADYVKTIEEFEFLPESIEAMKCLIDQGYEIIIISNQAGVARGIMTEEDLSKVNQYMSDELIKRGVIVKAMYHCPHGWDDGCDCRKPKPGMFFQAVREHAIDLTKTIFIGDDERDAQAGEAAGIKTFLVAPEINLFQIVNGLIKTQVIL